MEFWIKLEIVGLLFAPLVVLACARASQALVRHAREHRQGVANHRGSAA
jgi:hypothetical protein